MRGKGRGAHAKHERRCNAAIQQERHQRQGVEQTNARARIPRPQRLKYRNGSFYGPAAFAQQRFAAHDGFKGQIQSSPSQRESGPIAPHNNHNRVQDRRLRLALDHEFRLWRAGTLRRVINCTLNVLDETKRHQ